MKTHAKQAGRRIGRYEIIEEIGRGGMATVYRAVDTLLERQVALKLLHPHLVCEKEAKTRFQREAKTIARLKHESITEVYDYAEAEGDDIFIAMELVKGHSLRVFIEENSNTPILPEAAALLLRGVALALSHAHEQDIIHRDVKPENILIGEGGQIKLSDFGIARLEGLSNMTVTGQILGSPAYMSPEHIELGTLDARADVFSFGTILYELTVGRKPFAGKSPHAIIKRVVDGDFDDPLTICPSVGLPVANILRKCLAHSPEKRYASAQQIVADLDAMLLAMGIVPSSDLLCAFLKDPERWTAERRPQIVESTLALGLAALKARRRNEAVDHFNRVLAYEPGNPRALSTISRISKGKTINRWVHRALIIAPILLVVVGTVWSLLPTDPRADRRTPTKTENQQVNQDQKKPLLSAAQQASAPNSTAPLASVSSKDVPVTRVKPITRHPLENRTVVFAPSPMAVNIAIDDDPPFAFGPASRSKNITVGAHSVTFIPLDEKRFVRQTWQVEIPSGDAPFDFRERLRWRPARLLVQSNAPDAQITIPKRGTGKAGEPIDVAIQKGPTETLSVLVSSRGYIPRTKQVTMSAGELLQVEVPLEKESTALTSPTGTK